MRLLHRSRLHRSAGYRVSLNKKSLIESVFPGDSDMAARMRAFYWSTTDLGPVEEWSGGDQTVLRDAVPESSRRAYDVIPIVRTIADEDSVTVLREAFAPELVTALVRIEGRPAGVIANNCKYQAGVVTGDAAYWVAMSSGTGSARGARRISGVTS